MEKLALLFVAGGLGALCRLGVNLLSLRLFGTAIWGTVIANVLGSLLFGIVWCLAQDARPGWFTEQGSVIVLVGFLGAFTTFSTFAFEAQALLRNGEVLHFAGYLLLQNLLGIIGVMLGIYLVRELFH